MDEILLLLLKKGAHAKPVKLTTSEIGMLLSMSQQNASRKLLQLEKEGRIERRKDGVVLSKKAYDELSSLYCGLKAVFEGSRLSIEGVIEKGLGEGGYYLSLEGYRKQIKDKLGFAPFPGTLNVRMDEGEQWKRQRLLEGEPISISGFRDKERSYGDLFAYRCTLEGRQCAIIIPLRTHHGPQILELICPFDARKALGKKEGGRVKVVI